MDRPKTRGPSPPGASLPAGGGGPSLHPDPPTLPGSPSAHPLAALFLPFLLTVLPYFVLQGETQALRALHREDQKREWTERTRRLAARIPEMAELPYWVGEAGRELQQEFSEALGDREPSRELVRSALRRAAQRVRLPEGRASKLWASWFPDPGFAQPAVMLTGEGFSTDARFVISRILEEPARELAQLPNQLLTEAWETRIQATFGEGASGDLFAYSQRGQPFHVIFQGRNGIALWNLLMARGRPVGSYFLVLPIDSREGRLATRTLFRRWDELFAREGIWPAFLPWPGSGAGSGGSPAKLGGRGAGTGFRHGGILLHPRLRRPDCRRLVRTVARKMVTYLPRGTRTIGLVSLPAELTLDPQEEEGSPARLALAPLPRPRAGASFSPPSRSGGGPGRKGAIHDPAVRAAGGERIPSLSSPAVAEGGWWALAGNPSPWMRHLPLFLAPAPPAREPFVATLARLYGCLLALAWPMLFAYCGLGGRLGSPGVRRELLLWFVGLVATPLALIIGTGEKLIANLESNREFQLTRAMERSLLDIETGSARLTMRQLSVARALARTPGLGRQFRDLGAMPPDQAGKGSEGLLASLMEKSRAGGLDTLGLFLFGRSDRFVRFDPGYRILPRSAANFAGFHEAMALELLSTLGPGTRPAGDPVEKRRDGILPGTASRTAEPKKVSTAAAIGGLGVFQNNQDMITAFDTATTYQFGGRHLMRYSNLIQVPGPDPHEGGNEGRPLGYVFFLIWNQASQYAGYLADAVQRANQADPRVRLFAFRQTPDGLQMVEDKSAPNRDPELGYLARLVRNGRELGKVGGKILLALPSQRMPGYILGAVGSLEPVQRELDRERLRIAGAILLILLLIVAAGAGLERWLAQPIVRMTAGLQQVADNHLQVRVGEERADELGEAGRTLDQMTDWLQERQVMSRFVSPKVLEVVAGGDLEQATRPTARDLTLLVTDVRSFTTMSESNPPDRIFALINRHLQIMTTIIQEHGGIIDRFIGDAIQAVFFPGPGRPMVDRALAAAAAMMAAHQAHNRDRESRGEFPFQIGIGIEHGQVVTGVLGARDVRLDFTVMGEPFKHAADLEACSKKGKALRIVCSPEVKGQADPTFRFVPLEDRDHPGLWELAAVRDLDEASPPAPPTPPPPGGPETATLQEPPPAPPPASSVPSRPSPRLTITGLLGFLAFWLVPLVLTLTSFRTIEEAQADSRRTRIQARLQDDLDQAERTVEPQLQGGLWLKRKVNEITRNLDPSRPFGEGLRMAVEAKMRDLSRFFPSCSWFYFRHLPGLVQGRVSPESSELVASGGQPMSFGETSPGELFGVLKCDAMGLELGLPRGREGRLETQMGLRSLSDLHDGGLQALTPFKLGARARWLFWTPFLSPVRVEGNPPGLENSVLPTARFRYQSVHFHSGLMIFIDPADLRPELAIEALIRNLASFGCLAAVASSPESISRHPDFWADPGLNRAMERLARDPQALPDPGERFTLLRGRVFLDREYALILARTFDGETGTSSSGAGGPANNLFPRLRFLVLAGVLVWGVGGLWILIRALVGGSLPLRSLYWRLSGAFLLTILPALVLGILFMERSSGESQVRQEVDLTRRLQGTLQAIDESRDMFLAWEVSAMERLFNLRRVKDTLKHLEGRSANAAQQEGERLLFALERAATRIGFPFGRSMLVGPAGLGLNYGFRRGKADQSMTFFSHMFLASLRLLNPDLQSSRSSREAANDLLYGVGREEARDFLSSILPAAAIAEMVHAPRTISRMGASGQQESIIRFFLWHLGNPRYALQSRLREETIDFPHLNHWARRLSGRPDPAASDDGGSGQESRPCRLEGIVVRGGPAFIDRPPFWRVSTDVEGYVSFHNDPVYASEETSALAQMADLSGFPASRILGRGPDATLQMALRGPKQGRRILLGSARLGRVLAENERATDSRRALLAALALLSAVLALRTSRRFLEPVLELDREARRIMAGDFAARLPQGRGGEFGQLATAFNQMAAGVAEGRLLSQFVSEAVRFAAKDKDREEAARQGENLEVTVIFAGLADFKHLMATVHPVRVVEILNRFLDRMAQTIIAHGGDIDKFIGDKILAVFHPARLGGPEAAALAAARAAAAMQAGMAELREELPNPLGVGIVTGPVLAGIMGTADVRLEYTVIGDTVNLASRLGDMALRLSPDGRVLPDTEGSAGGILLEASTFELIRRSPGRDLTAAMEPLELPPIKGKTRSVSAFRFAGR